jgi:hypothetical protein
MLQLNAMLLIRTHPAQHSTSSRTPFVSYLIRIPLGTDFLDADLCAIFREHDVLLFQLMHAALGKLVRVEEDLLRRKCQ